jgi:hypothetical protein
MNPTQFYPIKFNLHGFRGLFGLGGVGRDMGAKNKQTKTQKTRKLLLLFITMDKHTSGNR